MKESKTTFLVGIAAVLVVLALAVYGYMFFDLKSKNETISSVLNDINFQLTEETRADSAKNIVKDTESQIEELGSRIVGKDTELVEFIEYIERLGARNGGKIKLNSVDIGVTATDTPGFGVLDFKVTLLGSWGSQYAFLSQLESIPYKTSIRQVSISSGEGGGWTGTFNFSVVAEQ